MFLKRAAALALCAFMIIPAAVGCGNNAETPPPDISEPGTVVTESPPPVFSDTEKIEDDIDSTYRDAYNTYPADTVILTANGYDVKWDEFFFYAADTKRTLELYGQPIDYKALLENAALSSLSYPAVLYGAKQLDIEITEEDNKTLEEDMSTAEKEYGGEEQFMAQLESNAAIFSKELFRQFLLLDILIQRCYNEQYGEMASFVSDETVIETFDTDEYLFAKHILRLKPDDGNEEGSTKAHEEAAEILSTLKNYDGGDFDTFFDEQMFEHSEDAGGLASHPNGYLYQDGDMVPEFYEGTLALKDGQLSEIIETTYGYHIIYRLPVNYDMVPFRYSNQGYNTTLRQIAANFMFNTMFESWIDALEVTYSDTYENLDLETLFNSET